MFLKRIILKNFKSFSNKSILDFTSPCTAIVGPNGSGKSNIVDAIRWVLGEQSFKNLRINRGSDLIFSSKNKNFSAGFAEVELIFNNSPKIFPLEMSELSILRRIDKENNNDYFLNHQPCLLKNIIELSAAAKIGLRGLSIINQGSIENILRVSSSERRIMLEENLGLKNLEIKKEEARRKLENTLINLDKIQALQQEILPHLRSLKREVGRWEKREKIKEQLSLMEEKYFINVYRQILQENSQLDINPEEIKEKIKEIEKIIKKKEEEIGLADDYKNKDIENKIRQITQEIIDLQNKKSLILRNLGRKEASEEFIFSREFLKKKIVLVKEELQELLTIYDLEKIKQRIKDLIQSLTLLLNYRKGSEDFQDQKSKQEIEKIQEDLKEIEKRIGEKNKLLNDFQAQLSKRSLDFKKKFQDIEIKRTEKENLYRELQREEILNEKFRLHLEDFKRRIREAGMDFKRFKEIYDSNKDKIDTISQDEIFILEKNIWKKRQELSEIGKENENIINEYKEVSSRYEFLTQQIDDLNKGIKDLNLLINNLSNQIKEKFNKAIKEINKEFNRYFRLIFNGGSAKLVQTEEKTNAGNLVLGVEIKVNLPKTELKNLEMLSGGEKTLVAICLLFALIKQAGPPLLVVDEIDAALDEENSRRFSEILKTIGKNTQFIVITHNRITMSAAQIIYGVTLLENNSSKFFSLKLEEAEALADKG